MIQTKYVPIYEWGDNPDSVHGNISATNFYCSLSDLYGSEPDAAGHYEVVGKMPTKNEFKQLYDSKSEAP